MVRIEAAIASCPGLEAIADESAPRFIGPDQISGCSSYPTSSTGLFQKAKRIARLLTSNLEMFSYQRSSGYRSEDICTFPFPVALRSNHVLLSRSCSFFLE